MVFKLLCGVVVLVAIILTSVLVGVSFKVIEANDAGLDYDEINMKLDTSTVYEGGTFFLGLGHRFIQFPKTQQTIKFANGVSDDGDPVVARTKDGLPIAVSFSFNYRIKTTAEELVNLYMKYGEEDEVRSLYGRIARNVIRSVAAEWETFQYFTVNKTAIQEDMKVSLAADVNSQGAIVESFQILDISIPSSFQEARTRQETANQQISQALNDLSVARINAQSSVQIAEQKASLIVSNANNTAAQMKLRMAANVQSLTARYQAERESYLNLRQTLGLTVRELLTMVWLDAQADAFASTTATAIIDAAEPARVTLE